MSYWQFKKRSCFPAFIVKDAVLDDVPFSDIPKKLLSVEFSQTTQHIDKKNSSVPKNLGIFDK